MQENTSQKYAQSAPYTKMIRDCMVGVPALKSQANQQIYLPPVVCDDSSNIEVAAKYARQLAGAEYDNIPSATIDTLQGALAHQPNDYENIESSAMAHIVYDCDGDGLTLDEHIKVVQSELLQMKYCGLLAEYSDLSTLGIEEDQALTRAQVKALGLRSSIKIYNRESIINQDFKNINGTKQLAWVLLRQCELKQDPESFTSDEITTLLLLALDADGKYYQKRWVEGESEGWSDAFYPESTKGMLSYIPFEYVIEGNFVKGDIPAALGYIFPIADKALHRYRVSAQLKEAMYYSASPSTFSSGWTEQAFAIYKEMTGKDYIPSGAGSHVPLPDGGEYGIVDWKADSSAFFTYLENNAKEIKAQGGSFDTEQEQEETATAKVINTAERTSVLSTVQAAIEKCYNRMIGYCAELETGKFEIGDVKLNREFMSVKLSAQDQKAILDNYLGGVYGREEALRLLENGGVLTDTAEVILSQMVLSGDAV